MPNGVDPYFLYLARFCAPWKWHPLPPLPYYATVIMQRSVRQAAMSLQVEILRLQVLNLVHRKCLCMLRVQNEQFSEEQGFIVR